MCVRTLSVMDIVRSFEYEFFEQITHSFLLLNSLIVFNQTEQKRSRQLFDHEQVSSVVEYPHLTKLDLQSAHIDYVEQFLINTRTCLPHLNVLRVQFEHLVIVRENFTNNATRLNCIQLKRVITEETMVHSRDFYLYFPFF